MTLAMQHVDQAFALRNSGMLLIDPFLLRHVILCQHFERRRTS